MRLLIKLGALNAVSYSSFQYHKLQGFVYKLLEKAGLEFIHNKPGYRFFCFSNIFPIGDVKAGDVRNFIISSPSKAIINEVAKTLPDHKDFNIGEALFSIREFKTFRLELGSRYVRIESSTPIVIRIPERKYDKYGIPMEERKRNYVYWRPKYSFEAFVKQLTENLIKKYNEFYGAKIKDYNLFETFKFKKPIATKIIIEGRSYDVVGSLWEFAWTYMDEVQRRIIEFGLDAGFGERNSMGFGFMNPVNERKPLRNENSKHHK